MHIPVIIKKIRAIVRFIKKLPGKIIKRLKNKKDSGYRNLPVIAFLPAFRETPSENIGSMIFSIAIVLFAAIIFNALSSGGEKTKSDESEQIGETEKKLKEYIGVGASLRFKSRKHERGDFLLTVQ